MPNKIATVRIYIEGREPILFNRPAQTLLYKLWSGDRAPVTKGTKSQKDDAAEKLCRDEQGRIGLPDSYLWSCLVIGGRKVKMNAKSAISTAETTQLPVFLKIVEESFPFVDRYDPDYDPEKEWKPDLRRGVNPHDKSMVGINRPRIDRWGFFATLEIDLRFISHKVVIELLQMSGKSPGLGDFRPGCQGKFGQFRLRLYELISERETDDGLEIIGIDLSQEAAPAKKATAKRGAARKPSAKSLTDGRATDEEVDDAKEVMPRS